MQTSRFDQACVGTAGRSAFSRRHRFAHSGDRRCGKSNGVVTVKTVSARAGTGGLGGLPRGVPRRFRCGRFRLTTSDALLRPLALGLWPARFAIAGYCTSPSRDRRFLRRTDCRGEKPGKKAAKSLEDDEASSEDSKRTIIEGGNHPDRDCPTQHPRRSTPRTLGVPSRTSRSPRTTSRAGARLDHASGCCAATTTPQEGRHYARYSPEPRDASIPIRCAYVGYCRAPGWTIAQETPTCGCRDPRCSFRIPGLDA